MSRSDSRSTSVTKSARPCRARPRAPGRALLRGAGSAAARSAASCAAAEQLARVRIHLPPCRASCSLPQMPRVFSGIQPSGELHIGNYLGAVSNWVALQDAARVLLLHRGPARHHAAVRAAGAGRAAPSRWPSGLLAAGIDPERATLFVQSHVPEHTELAWAARHGHAARRAGADDAVQGQVRARGEPSRPGCSTTRCSRRPTSCSTGPTRCRWARTRCSTSSWRARSRGAGTRASATEFFPGAAADALHAPGGSSGSTGRRRCPRASATPSASWTSPEAIWEKLRPAMTDPARKTKQGPRHAGDLQHLRAAPALLHAGPGGARRGAVPHGRAGAASTASGCWRTT